MTVPSGYLSFFFSRKKGRQEIAEVRRTILDKLLFVFSLVGLPATLLGAIRSYTQGRWGSSIIYLALYFLFVLVTLSRKFPFRFRALILISSLFLVALTSLVAVGMSGSGVQLMLGVCFLAAMLFGLRGGMLALLITLVCLSVLAIGMTTGFIDIAPERMITSRSLVPWLTTICVFFMIVSITIIGFQMFNRRIEESLDLLEEHKRELEAANEHLREASVIISKSRAVAFLWSNREGWPVEYVSDNVANVFGYTAEEFLTGRIGYSSAIHPGDSPRVAGEVSRYSRDPGLGGFTHEPYRIITKQGEVRWVEDTTQVRRDSRGEITHYQGIVQDITERKQAEDALQQSERQYRELYENLRDGSALVDVQGRICKCNSRFLNMLGYTFKEISLLTYEEITPIRWHSLELEILLKQVNMRGYSDLYEKEYIKKGGAIFPVELQTYLVKDSNGAFAGYWAFVRDITDRKRTEETFRESEERFRLAFDNANIGVCLVSTEGKLLQVNTQMCNIFGYRKEEFERMTINDLAHPEDKNISPTFIKKALTAEVKDSVFEKRYYHKKGHIVFGQVSSSLVRDAQGAPLYFISHVLDITDRKREEEERRNLETKLQRAQKMEAIGLMAGGVAHDLNNMLSAFVTLPELILMEIPEENQKLRMEIQMIMNSGQRTAAIVDDLLTVTRGVTMAQDTLNLNHVVQEYMRSPEFEKLRKFHPGIEVVTELADDLLPIRGSRVHLMKALMNLVSNASEAFRSSDSGVVSVSTQNRYVDASLQGYEKVNIGEYAVLVVKDNGLGISPEDTERIFEPFYSKKVMGRSGTGLGLSVVWNTVTGHDGYIHVESGGGGTVFELFFPITRESVSEREKPLDLKQYQGRGEKVLVVDDELNQRVIAVDLLRKLGYRANAVSGGQEALEFLKEQAVDILLLDMVMPGMDGCDTFSRIVRLKPGQKAVIASGFSLSDRVKKAQELGAGAYIRKPYSIEKLGLAIKTELARSA